MKKLLFLASAIVAIGLVACKKGPGTEPGGFKYDEPVLEWDGSFEDLAERYGEENIVEFGAHSADFPELEQEVISIVFEGILFSPHALSAAA